MSEYLRISTTYAVWKAIKKAHPELRVFGSYTYCEGSAHNPNLGECFTSYGFVGQDIPIMEALTTWNVNHAAPHARDNARYKYWLCIPKAAEKEEARHD